jgi:hypothetical protein
MFWNFLNVIQCAHMILLTTIIYLFSRLPMYLFEDMYQFSRRFREHVKMAENGSHSLEVAE